MGCFAVAIERGGGGYRMPVWYWAPDGQAAAAPVLVVLHGFQRNAEAYRDAWLPYAARHGVLLLVPEFNQKDHAGPRAYEVGNMRNPERTAFLPSGDWAFSAIEQVFDAARQKFLSGQDRYSLYGHSAGGQLVHRMLTFMPEARIETAIAANAGAYTMPWPEERFPYGLRGAPWTEAGLARLLAHRLILLLGEADTDETHPVLLKSPEALRQGRHRLERGQTYYREGREMAASLASPFGWELVTVPGVGHSNTAMAAAAARLLYG
jgi:poly(3-hydroxybutyrate) depolymerase